MVVDDNYYNIFAISSMLKQWLIEADTAMDGVEAIKKVKQLFEREGQTYDLILMDFAMPICNGPKSTEAIRKYLQEKAPGLAQPYICCLTSDKDQQYSEAATQACMDDYLIKPIFKTGIQNLLAKVRKHQLKN